MASPEKRILEPFTNPDYSDHFVVRPGEPFPSLDAFVERFLLSQPSWLTLLSMGIGSIEKRTAALEELRDGTGTALGNWEIIDRADNSITFADDVRILRYRLIFTVPQPDKGKRRNRSRPPVPSPRPALLASHHTVPSTPAAAHAPQRRRRGLTNGRRTAILSATKPSALIM